MRGAARPRLEPGIGLAAVLGQDEAVRTLQETVVTPWKRWQDMAFDHAEVDPPQVVLITGAVGSGKSFLATQLVAELQWHLFAASPAELLASRVGDAEKRTAQLFVAARRCAPSCVLLEDLENLLPNEREGSLGDEMRESMQLSYVGTSHRLDRMASWLLAPQRSMTHVQLKLDLTKEELQGAEGS
eukprot:Skav220853  [mRNA]  locus=scaffold1888:532967:535135:- [translate_table: standard]